MLRHESGFHPRRPAGHSVRLKLISCEVLYREMCAAAARAPHQVDVEFLPKGLHDLGSARMLERLQAAIDAVPHPHYDAVILGYALCGNGVAGLRARQVPIVIPRAHDCITLFMGSRERYLEYFTSHPGVYFKTTGWLERGDDPEGQIQLFGPTRLGMNAGFDDLVKRYGEENARYIWHELTHNYRQITFIEMGVEPDSRFELQAREQADRRGWKFEIEGGDLTLFQRLVAGDWDPADFLTVPPGHVIRATYGDDIVAAAPVPDE
jgi:hypothetical protein